MSSSIVVRNSSSILPNCPSKSSSRKQLPGCLIVEHISFLKEVLILEKPRKSRNSNQIYLWTSSLPSSESLQSCIVCIRILVPASSPSSSSRSQSRITKARCWKGVSSAEILNYYLALCYMILLNSYFSFSRTSSFCLPVGFISMIILPNEANRRRCSRSFLVIFPLIKKHV